MLSDHQLGALERHYDLLVRWNRVLNLTSIRNVEEAVVRHYCECLFFASLLPECGRILDLGSGAGFPGIPIAILRSACTVSLLESHKRKAVFLREATRELGNVEVLAQRAEDVSGAWDVLVSRAVSPSEVLEQVPRLAPRVGMLVGDNFLRECERFSGIQWEEPVKLPWGTGRWAVFGMFHVEHRS
ncbi:MAG: 16S rRNA (guanine(527)-N(7))-methyltransferase RsmG [Bryobacteraceae bacterium]